MECFRHCILFSRSSVVIEALLHAKERGLSFRVIVVDSRPCFEGKQTATLLSQAKIPVTYILVNAIGYIMKQVDLHLIHLLYLQLLLGYKNFDWGSLYLFEWNAFGETWYQSSRDGRI